MGRASLGSKISLRRGYLAFFLSALLVSALYMGWMAATAAVTRVDFVRDGNEFTATATVSSNEELKFLRDSSNVQYWDYSIVESKADCNAAGFSDSGVALRNGSDNSASFTRTAPENDEHICLKVLYGRTSSQRFSVHYAYVLFDVTRPEITVSQTPTSLVAEATDSTGIKSWAHDASASDGADCENQSYTDTDTSGNNRYTLAITSSNNDSWYCFQAIDGQGNEGYSTVYQIDTVAPRLSVLQSPDSALVTITVTQDDDNDSSSEGNADINADSWQYVQTTRTCASGLRGWRDLDVLTNDLGKNSAAITFSISAVGKTYCFRVADEANNYAYQQYEVGSINEPPVVNRVSQSRNLVTATARDAQYLDTGSWQYAIASSATCDSSVSGWQDTGILGFSVNAQGAAIVDVHESDIDESRSDKWLCFRVADNIEGNYGYRSLNVDALAPTINVTQNGARLNARADSSDRAVSSTWYYVRGNNDFNCNEDAFEIQTPARRGSSITLVSRDVGDHFCFRVADRYNNFGYSNTYRVQSLDTVAPRITATQTNSRLTVSAASSEGVDNDTWQYESGFSSQPTCAEVRDSSYRDIADNRIIELSESDIGDWFCIRAADAADNYGYVSVRIKHVDATEPRVSVSRARNTLTAESSAEDINSASWQYAVSAQNDSFNCDEGNADLQFNAASRDNYKVTLNTSHEDRYFCFRVADKAGNYGYAESAKIRDVETAPELTVVQEAARRRLIVSTAATDVDGLTWGWAVFSSDPGDCEDVSYSDVTGSGINQNTRRIYVNEIADSQNSSYYCFRVADTSTTYGSNYGYAKHRYDLSRPAIEFSLSNSILTISSTSTDIDESSWRYAKFATQPDCPRVDVARILPSNNKRILLTPADNGNWFCFRVSDTNGNVTYRAYNVGGISNATTPVIVITQTQHVVIATSANRDLNNASWRYAVSAAEPYCGAGSNLAFVYNQGSPNRVNLSTLNSGYGWVCFKVENNAGNVGYAKVKVDRQAPTIKVVQSNTILTVESVDTDLNGSTWGYAKAETDFNCGATTSFTSLNFNSAGVTFDLDFEDSNDYYCFRVADAVGNFGYEKIRLNPVVISAPILSVTQKNTSLIATASGVDANSWRYTSSSADFNCSDANATLGLNAASKDNRRVSLSESDSGRWFCFSVTGNNGARGYAKILVDKVDSRKPIVKVKQGDDTLIATADEDIASWEYVELPSSGASCTQSAFSGASAQSGNQVVLTSDDDQAVYCFKAVDNASNVGYGTIKVKISVEKPVVKDTTPAEQPVVVQEEEEEAVTTGEEEVVTGEEVVEVEDDETREADDEAEPAADDDDEDTNWWPIVGIIAGGALLLTIVIVMLVSPSKKDDDSDDPDYV